MNKYKEYDELEESVKEANERKSTSTWKTYFKDKNLEFWNPVGGEKGSDKGTHYIDIIPYIAGKNDFHREEGKKQHVLDLWVHFKVGPENHVVVCPKRNASKACPICEEIQRLQDEDGYVWSKKEADQTGKPSIVELGIKAKRRNVMNVWVGDNDETINQGVQLYEVPDYFMGENLRVLAATGGGKAGGFVNYAHPDSKIGKLICFKKVMQGKNVEFLGHQFLPREDEKGNPYDIDKEMLAEAQCLDEMIEILSYDEIAKLFFGEDSVEDAPVETARGKAKRNTSAKETPQDEGCPVGIFGIEFGEHAECNDCKLNVECEEASLKDKAEEVEPEEEAPVRRRGRGSK